MNWQGQPSRGLSVGGVDTERERAFRVAYLAGFRNAVAAIQTGLDQGIEAFELSDRLNFVANVVLARWSEEPSQTAVGLLCEYRGYADER